MNVDELLLLPATERRRIAKKLWESLSPTQTIVKEDEALLELLNRRWQNVETGTEPVHSPEQLRKKIAEYRSK